MTTEVTILEKILNKIDHLEQRFEKRFDKMEADIVVIKADIVVMKADINIMKSDNSTMKADLKEAVGNYQNQRSADVRWFVGIVAAIMVSMMTVSVAALMMNVAA